MRRIGRHLQEVDQPSLQPLTDQVLVERVADGIRQPPLAQPEVLGVLPDAHGPGALQRIGRPDAQPLLIVSQPERGAVHGRLVAADVEQPHVAADVAPPSLGGLGELRTQPLGNLGERHPPPQRVVIQQELGGVL
eukprot:8208609-Alexandrium_andersonii.AAC.1